MLDTYLVSEGVVDGFDWNDVGTRLKVENVAPSELPVMERTWVELGEFQKEGSEYLKSPLTP